MVNLTWLCVRGEGLVETTMISKQGDLDQPISVARPLLPLTQALLPYLNRIDKARIYTNIGPLARELEDRIALHLNVRAGSVVTVANATQGLTLSLQAQGARPGTLCLMPAWTFAASGHAAVAAGLLPHFLDVDADDWCLQPETVFAAVRRLGTERIGAIMPVAPFGGRIDTAAWDIFYEQTRLPVVIDAAAAFDSLRPGLVPAVVSLHATKVLGAGEGGFVVSGDRHLTIDIQRRSNFGFYGAREARVPATNAKMSEYAAAVGLASLDHWQETRGCWQAVAAAYRKALLICPGVVPMPGLDRNVSSTFVVELEEAIGTVIPLAMGLAHLGISTRRWWGSGLQNEAAFSTFTSDPLPVTARLGRQVIGLPCSLDLTPAEIDRVCATVMKILCLKDEPRTKTLHPSEEKQTGSSQRRLGHAELTPLCLI
jgi:dTDP-4-amino-4,6-dideoxygalactose transaminase